MQVPGFLQTFQTQIPQLLTNFQEILFFFQNSMIRFDRLLTYSSLIHPLWCMHFAPQSSDVKVIS